MNKLLIITGPTATGKTSLAIKLAEKFDGEVVSADSRQVYRHMDIGTGKDTEEYRKASIKVWGIDLVEPDYSFNVSDWVKYATRAITDIQWRGRLPIVVGGTGLYIKSLLFPPETIRVPVDRDIRYRLLGYQLEKLQRELIGIDRRKWESMNESDRQNSRRLVRAIEIADHKMRYPVIQKPRKPDKYAALIIGLTTKREIINERIDRRVEERMKQGMIEEIEDLLARGYSWDLPSMSGLGYKEFRLSSYYPIILRNWKIAEHQYAKRQMTYLKKFFPEIKWFDVSEPNYIERVQTKIKAFLV